MLKGRKILLIGVITAIALAMIVGGIALAQTTTTPENAAKPGNAVMARVAEILNIDQQKLENAFEQAKREAADSALDARIKQMVDSGKLTQEQADQYKNWWKSRPEDMPRMLGPMGKFNGPARPGMHWRLPMKAAPPVVVQ